MGATITLLSTTLSVDPGGEVACEVRVRNTGAVVDQFSLSVVGDTARWASVDPPSLSMMPGEMGSATLKFRPPRSPDTPAASLPFGVRAISREDPEGSAVEEGVLAVGRFLDAFAEIIPRTSRGRYSGRHEVAVDNRGNIRMNAAVSAVDPDNQLAFDFRPPSLAADANTALFSRLTVRPRKRFLRGPTRTHQFQVMVRPDGAEPITLEANMLQEAVIPGWVPKAAVGLLAGLVALAVLGRVVAHSAASSAARAEVAPVVAQADALQKQQAQTNVGLISAQQAIHRIDPSYVAPTQTAIPIPTVESPSPTRSATPPADTGTPVDGRLGVTAPPGQDAQSVYNAPSGKGLAVTDLVLENPQSDSGSLFVQRDSTVLLQLRLDNFRDFDYHWTSPLLFLPNQHLTLRVHCENAPPAAGQGGAGQPAKSCTPALYFSGLLKASS